MIEELLGAKLPSGYLKFIQGLSGPEQSGERFESEGFEGSFEFEGEGETCIDSFFSLSDDSGDANSVLSYLKARIPGLPEKVIPIARDPGDWLICLDMRDHSGAVVIFDPDSGRVYSVTESFEKFLSIIKK
jgi:hypothetical protein